MYKGVILSTAIVTYLKCLVKFFFFVKVNFNFCQHQINECLSIFYTVHYNPYISLGIIMYNMK